MFHIILLDVYNNKLDLEINDDTKWQMRRVLDNGVKYFVNSSTILTVYIIISNTEHRNAGLLNDGSNNNALDYIGVTDKIIFQRIKLIFC